MGGWIIAAYAVVLGGWFYSKQKQPDLYSHGVYDFLHATWFGVAFAFGLPA